MCGFGWGPHTGIIVSSSQNITYTVPAREQIYTDGKYASNPPQLIRLNVFVRKLQSQPENRYIQTANSQIRIKSPTTREVKCISQKTTVPAREQIYTDGKYASNHPQPMRLNVLVRKLYCLKWLKFQFFELEIQVYLQNF